MIHILASGEKDSVSSDTIYMTAKKGLEENVAIYVHVNTFNREIEHNVNILTHYEESWNCRLNNTCIFFYFWSHWFEHPESQIVFVFLNQVDEVHGCWLVNHEQPMNLI